MKHIKIILGLVLFASVSTFAQSPRIKLNQITKDTVKGSVLISSPSDSGMVYSRDFYVAYGADTVLILYGDTLAATSGIISSVLSDGVTITGDGTSGNELKVDTATVISTIKGLVDSLLTKLDVDFGNVTGTLPVANGGTNLTSLTANGILYSSSTSQVATSSNLIYNGSILQLNNNGDSDFKLTTNNTGSTSTDGFLFRLNSTGIESYIWNWEPNSYFIFGASGAEQLRIGSSGVIIGLAATATEKLDVNGNARFRSIGSGASSGALHYTSTGVLTTNTSDARLKTNLQPLENTLNKLLGINTYTFNWIDETDRVDLGMIAQEVEQIFPNLVFTNNVDGYKGIHYDKFSSILTKAIQEQQEQIETLQIELDAKSTKIDQLKTLITDLTNRIQILENK